jgi:18S rRNA (adenine1779-N6/adenine1780-N6)-dimethyltransferase
MIYLEKSSGQYIITNDALVDKIISSLDLRSTDTVLELGSGSGAITTRLLLLARHVVANESDSILASEASSRAKSEGFTNLEMLKGDAITRPLPRFDVCFANLPFSLSAPVLFKLISHRPLWRSAVMILQREFTDALIADPGERNYSRLSMNAAVFARSERVHRINGACFYPVPPVESALVRLTPRNPPPLFDFNEFNALTRVAFIEKKRAIKSMFDRPFVLKTLETNYKNYCSFHRIPTSSLPFPKYLRSALDDSGLADYPAKHLAPEAMEHLLGVLHDRGIYFTSLVANKKLIESVEDIEQSVFPIEQHPVTEVVTESVMEALPSVS